MVQLLPTHITDPVVMVAAKEGLAQVAGQNVQVLSGETVHWASGQDSNWVAIGALKRIRIATQGGASILIEGGNITVKAPGRIEVESGDKKFAGPDRMDLKLSAFSDSGMYTRSFVFKDELGNELPGFDHLLSRPQAKERMNALLQGQSRAVFTSEPEALGADLVFPKIEIGEDTL